MKRQRTTADAAAAALVVAAALVGRCSGLPCNNLCSGHGNCVMRVCHCWEGWQGADCSERTCPADLAWFDRAIETDVAHENVECSNMGTCDRETGTCVCRDGFHGRACSRLACPNDCSQHGVCQDMGHYASVKDPGEGEVYRYDDVWDSGKVFGCNCDEGFFGPDCSLRHCPRGDDPFTGTAIDPSGVQRNEVQTFTCRADAGYFTLSFRGATTAHVYHDDTLADLKEKLLALPTLTAAAVEVSS